MRFVLARATRKFFTISISALLILGATSAQAQSTDVVKTAVVKHLGNTGETMNFQVKYENVTGERFAVTVRDHDGGVLFQEFFTDKQFDKKFKIPKADNERVTFQIRSVKENVPQTFEINTNTRMIEEVIVKRVD